MTMVNLSFSSAEEDSVKWKVHIVIYLDDCTIAIFNPDWRIGSPILIKGTLSKHTIQWFVSLLP